jgi:cyclophilin family peptidyl-prolyl cis-trans isomerase/protein-disulfide isomerase
MKRTSLLLLILILAATGVACGAQPELELPAATATATRSVAKVSPTPGSMECVLVSSAPTQGDANATPDTVFPPPRANDWSSGPQDAAVTFLEYTDFQASATPALDLNLAALAQKYPQDVRRVFRPFPLPNNDKSILAAAAAEAAGKQQRFWEMSQRLVEKQSAWLSLSEADFKAWLSAQAGELGLDAARFAQDLRDPAIQSQLQASQKFGLDARIPIMPFLLVNGRIYQGPRDLRSLENLVTLTRLEKRQFSECPPFVINLQKQVFATLRTDKGDIVLQLYPQKAPLAVNNFVFLARQGWYNGVTFHRVILGYVAQSGDPSGSGFGSPGYAFPDDVNDLRFDKPGVFAMVNAGPDSNGSQFFITYRAIPELNGANTIFGQVIQGMEVLNHLTARDPSSAVNLPDGDKILSISIEEK